MATTKYFIIAGTTVLDVKSKKSQAVEIAEAHKAQTGESVVVATGSGTIVADIAGRRRIKMSPPYTRVVQGVEAPEGLRVCYTKSRKGLVVLHDAEAGEYLVQNAKGKTLATFATTRECGRFTTDFKVPANA